MRVRACFVGVLFAFVNIPMPGLARDVGQEAHTPDFWRSFAAGLAVQTAVVLPSNSWVTDISFSRYGLGVLAAASASFVCAKVLENPKAKFRPVLHGAVVGGLLGGFAIFLAKKSDFLSGSESSRESYVLLDPGPWNAMVYGFLLIAPPLGAVMGLRHDAQAAFVEWEHGEVALGVPVPSIAPGPACNTLHLCSFTLLRIHLDEPH